MPFGFGKKKKNESLIEKDVSPIAQPSKEVESAGTTIVEKIEEVAFSAEDAVIDHTEQVTVTMTETVVEEEAVVEVVTSDAVDGGAEQLVEIEQVRPPSLTFVLISSFFSVPSKFYSFVFL